MCFQLESTGNTVALLKCAIHRQNAHIPSESVTSRTSGFCKHVFPAQTPVGSACFGPCLLGPVGADQSEERCCSTGHYENYHVFSWKPKTEA